MTTDELNVVLRASGTSTFRSQMQSCTTSTLAFKASVVAITAATSKFIKSALELASDLEEVQNVVDMTFGSMSDSVNKFSKNAISQFGLSETIAKRYSGTFGAMAKSFGFSTEEAVKMSTALTGLTGDVASFYNLESDVAYTKLKSVFTGETESLKDLGIVMTQTALDQYALEQGYSKTTKEMTEQEKVALRYKFIMDKLSIASGDYARTSDSWANMTRTAKLELQSLAAEIGSELMPAAKVIFSYVTAGIKTVLAWVKPVATSISSMVVAWKESSAVTKAFTISSMGAIIILTNLSKIQAVCKIATTALTMAQNILTFSMYRTAAGAITLKTALAGVLGWVALIAGAIGIFKLLSGATKSVDTNTASQSIASVASASDIAADSIGNLADSTKKLGDATGEIDNFLASFDEVNKVGGSSSMLSNIVSDDDIANIDDAAAGIGDLQSAIDDISFGSLTDSASDFFWNLADKVQQTKALWKNVIDAETFSEKLEACEKIVETWFGPSWTQYWERVGGDVYDIWNADTWSEKLEAANKLVKDMFGSKWTKYWNRVGEDVYDIWNANTWNEKITAANKLVEDMFGSKWTTFWQGVGERAYDIWNETTWEQKASAAESVVERVFGSKWTTFWQGVGSRAYDAFSALRSRSSSSGSSISGYASGGFPDTGQMFIARESGPEMVGRIGNKTAVANNDQITTAIYNAVKSALGTGNSRGGTTVLYVDGKVLGKATVDYINNQTMSSGQSPLVEIG